MNKVLSSSDLLGQSDPPPRHLSLREQSRSVSCPKLALNKSSSEYKITAQKARGNIYNVSHIHLFAEWVSVKL